MSKYFTVIDLVGDRFIGTVFDANTNIEVFKSKPHNSQSQASQEVREFLTNSTPAKVEQPQQPGSHTIVNTIKYTSAPGTRSPGRCCGR